MWRFVYESNTGEREDKVRTAIAAQPPCIGCGRHNYHWTKAEGAKGWRWLLSAQGCEKHTGI